MKIRSRKIKEGQRYLTRQMMRNYVISLLLYGGGLIAGIYGISSLLHRRVWYVTDSVWPLLNLLDDIALPAGGLIFALGMVVITRSYFKRALAYLDEVVEVSEKLAVLPEEMLFLSPELKNVQDRLNEAREKALHHAKAAKEAEQRKNDLIVYLAHDLKTPLTSVVGYLTLLRDEPNMSPKLQEKYTEIALNKAQRLEELINEFFDITRFNLTVIELNKERISLSRMLEQIMSEFLPLLQEKNLSWESEIEESVDFICDPDKLERVFDNLIRNAVNYSYDGTAIGCRLQKSEGQIVICISNHGRTISENKLERIFEQFFRLDSARSSTSGGAGLGLAIAKEIVECHGGEIMAESQEESIVFTVSFPCEEAEIRKMS